MEKYFDKDFFKALAGFLFLLLISGAIAISVRLYEKQNIASAPCADDSLC